MFSVSWRPRAVLVWVPGLSRSVPRGAVFCFAAPNGPQPGEILSRSASQKTVVRFVASKQAWTGKSVWRSASREPVVRFADSSLRGTVRVTLQLSSRHQSPSQGPSVERQIVGSGLSGRSTGCRSRTMSDGSRIQINLPAQRGRPDTKLQGRCIRFLEHHDRKITIFADSGEELADALGRACVDIIAFCITR